MGQDSIYLQVLSGDNSEPQHKNAKRVLKLLNRGKHWVLVTLLLANVIVNESLPVVLDRFLGGGVAAVVGSTILIGGCSRTVCLLSVASCCATNLGDKSSLAKSCLSQYACDMASPLAGTCPLPS